MRDGIDTVLPGQFDRTLPQRLRQLRPPRLAAAKLIQLALQLGDWLRNGCAFAVHNQPPPGRLNEANRLVHLAARTLAGNSHSIRLRSADKLVVYHAGNGKVVIIEYEVHGKVLGTGAPYDNRFVSIITVADRKIVHWRDYMDSLAAWNALNPRSS